MLSMWPTRQGSKAEETNSSSCKDHQWCSSHSYGSELVRREPELNLNICKASPICIHVGFVNNLRFVNNWTSPFLEWFLLARNGSNSGSHIAPPDARQESRDFKVQHTHPSKSCIPSQHYPQLNNLENFKFTKRTSKNLGRSHRLPHFCTKMIYGKLERYRLQEILMIYLAPERKLCFLFDQESSLQDSELSEEVLLEEVLCKSLFPHLPGEGLWIWTLHHTTPHWVASFPGMDGQLVGQTHSGPLREHYGELASSLAPTGSNLCQKECQIECQLIDRSIYLSYHLTIYPSTS